MAASKPRTTGNAHRLPFDALPAQKLEELCLWLVRREGYERAEYLGEAGSEQGRDVVAWKDGRRVVFQCKRVKSFGLAMARKEIEKLRALPPAEQPDKLVFVVSAAVSDKLRKNIRDAWGAEETCHFWSGGELDELVKGHPEIVREFFQVGQSWRWGVALSAIGLLLVLATWLWPQGEPRMLIVARDRHEKILAGFSFSLGGVESLATDQAGATELDLPPGYSPGRQIKLHLLSSPTKAAEWFLVNNTVNVPMRGSPAELVLMLRSDFRKFAAEARDAAPAVSTDRNDPGAARQNLLEVASRYDLTEDQLDAAIRSFAETASNLKDCGIAAYLKREYSAAEICLTEAATNKEDDFLETLRYLGASQYEQAKYDAAARNFEKALALRREDPALLSWLGRCFHELARWQKAESMMRRALEIDEANFGSQHPKVATTLNCLGQLLKDTDRLAEAESMMRRALEIDEASFGSQHPNVARDLNNLALLLQDTDRLTEAEPLMRRALKIDEASFGSQHPNVATTLNNLGQLLLAIKRLDEAEPLMRRALEIAEASFGSQHPNVAATLNNLGHLLQNTNRMAEAEPLMRRALEIAEASFGSQHPRVAIHLKSLALLLKDTSRLAEAEPLLRRVLEIDETSFGSQHPKVATDLNNLALLLKDTDRLDEAEPLIRRALEIDEASLGSQHPKVATDLNYLALLLQATNRMAETEPLIRRALEIDEARFGSQHPNVARDLNNLVLPLRATNRLAEAEPLMRRALDIVESRFGSQHPDVAIYLNNLATLLQFTNRLVEAEPLMRRAAMILVGFTRSTGHEHPNLRAALANYKRLLQEMGRSEDAIRSALQEIGWSLP